MTQYKQQLGEAWPFVPKAPKPASDQDIERNRWWASLTPAQRNEYDQMDDGTWEPDRND